MKISDLKTGMIVVLRNNKTYKVMRGTIYGDILYLITEDKNKVGGKYIVHLSNYAEKTMKHPSKILDIMCVISPKRTEFLKNTGKVIWKRDDGKKSAPVGEPRPITMAEIQARLGCNVIITK